MSELSDKIDLKAIERRAYLSYHEDGIIDILIGLSIITVSFYILGEMIWLMGSFVAVYTPMYMAMKKKYTFPRLGQVTFSRNRTGRTRNSFTFLIAINVLGVLGGFYFWWTFSEGAPPTWFPMFLDYFPIIIGAVGAVLAAVIAYITELKRFNGYAAASAQLLPISSDMIASVGRLFIIARQAMREVILSGSALRALSFQVVPGSSCS